MSMSGRVTSVKIRDDNDPTDIRTFNKPKIQVLKRKSNPKVTITLPPDEELIIEFNLNDCTYMEQSSTPVSANCIRIDSEKQIVIIVDKNHDCEDLLEYVHNYLTERASPPAVVESDDERERERERKRRERQRQEQQRAPSPPAEESDDERDRERERKRRERQRQQQEEEREREREQKREQEREQERKREQRERNQKSEPIQNDKVNKLIKALNDSNADDAAKIARQLAKDKQSIRFALDMINESGNAASRQPPQPVVEPLKLKLLIESFLIESCTNDQYDVAVLPGTTIKDLKQMVQQNANIRPNEQYWYISRDLLPDTYAFDGTQPPRINEKTVLILYIAKPQTA